MARSGDDTGRFASSSRRTSGFGSSAGRCRGSARRARRVGERGRRLGAETRRGERARQARGFGSDRRDGGAVQGGFGAGVFRLRGSPDPRPPRPAWPRRRCRSVRGAGRPYRTRRTPPWAGRSARGAWPRNRDRTGPPCGIGASQAGQARRGALGCCTTLPATSSSTSSRKRRRALPMATMSPSRRLFSLTRSPLITEPFEELQSRR